MRVTRTLLRHWGACWREEKLVAMVPKCGIVVSPEAVDRLLDAGVGTWDLLWVFDQILGVSRVEDLLYEYRHLNRDSTQPERLRHLAKHCP